jgi:hypothetical protein
MRSLKNYLFIFIASLMGVACMNAPDNFPSVPEITFENMEFASRTGGDSLIISVGFKDAEGDLGLNPTDIDPPFNAQNFRRTPQGALIFFGNRPPEAPAFNPLDWAINPLVNNAIVRDTVWVELNENHFNIFVQFFIKRNGRFTEFRWQAPPFFTTFNGRFPRFLNTNAERAVEGTIRYAMISSGWEAIFRNDTIRIDVQIQDRALNRSNVVSSPELTLNQIRRR